MIAWNLQAFQYVTSLQTYIFFFSFDSSLIYFHFTFLLLGLCDVNYAIRWAQTDSRFVGIFPWHFDTFTSTFLPGFEIGLESIFNSHSLTLSPPF